jgi:D-methionine transport system ATP-binding protein
MIRFEAVNKTFETKNIRVEACRDIHLRVEKGDIFGVVGYSGAGKSTLIRMVNGLEVPTSGRVLVNNVAVNELSRRELRKACQDTSMIFQQFNLVMSKTVFENVAMPLKLRHFPKAEIEKRVHEMLKFVELSEKAQVYPNTLSGGQKQRVGIARALVTNPSILLCDEATSALDPKTTDSILKLLQKVNREMGVTIMLITHQINVVQKICNKMAVMESGRVVEQGSVKKLFVSPEQELTKAFVDTIIEQEIPRPIYEEAVQTEKNYRIWKIRCLDLHACDDFAEKLRAQFDIDFKVLFMSVNELQEEVLTVIAIQGFGTDSELERVNQYFRKNYTYEEEGVLESACL